MEPETSVAETASEGLAAIVVALSVAHPAREIKTPRAADRSIADSLPQDGDGLSPEASIGGRDEKLERFFRLFKVVFHAINDETSRVHRSRMIRNCHLSSARKPACSK